MFIVIKTRSLDESGQAYGDFADCEAFNLIWSSRPIDTAHETLVEALNQLTFGQRGFGLTRFDSGSDLGRVKGPHRDSERQQITCSVLSSCSIISESSLMIVSLRAAYCFLVHQSATWGKPSFLKCSSRYLVSRLFPGKNARRSLIPPFFKATER